MGKSILTPNQHRILERANSAQLITERFYLTGGTALSAFYLQHRLSEDLDFFSEQSLEDAALTAWVRNTARDLHADVTEQTLREQIVFYFHFKEDVVKIDFAYFPFSPHGTFSHYKHIKIASIEDIATNKLQAIMTRSRGRDYVDLFAIMKKGKITARDLMKNYRLKFDLYVPPEQLVKRFTAVIEATDQPRFLGTIRWEDVESFFLAQAKQMESKVLR